jgi:pimeloyl-ACP methyl ester carboxylesterase
MDRAESVAMEERGDGEALALIHGVGANRRVWHRVVERMASNARVIAIDIPGFGDSPPRGPGFEIDEVADRVAAALLARTGEPFHLIGHSLGGAVALKVASRHAADVRSLVLAAPAGFAPRSAALARTLGFASAGFLASRRMVGPPLSESPVARRALLWGAVADGGRLRADDARLMIEASGQATRVRQAIEAVVALDLRTILEAVAAPVGLLWGERDRVVPVATGRRLLAIRPEAPLEVIPGAGHVPQLERPDEFIAALQRARVRLAAVTV